jgi:hypothetical protein
MRKLYTFTLTSTTHQNPKLQYDLSTPQKTEIQKKIIMQINFGAHFLNIPIAETEKFFILKNLIFY